MKRADEVYGTGLARSTSFGRKRVALSNLCLGFGDDDDDDFRKRRCFRDELSGADRTTSSLIDDLPEEIVIRILCGVEHDDLKSLFFVSKAIREATLVAKKSFFAYSTPPRKNTIFRRAEDHNTNEVDAPNAPKQSRIHRSRLSAKKLTDISVNLFGSDDEVVDEVFVYVENDNLQDTFFFNHFH